MQLPADDPAPRGESSGPLPTTRELGYRYCGLGYTTAVDAAIAPLGARQAQFEFEEIPSIDKAFLVLLANHHYLMECVRSQDWERLGDFVCWMLRTTGGYGVKAVNPGGIEKWKQGKGNVSSLDDVVDHFDVTPRAILHALARTVEALKLPHPLHVHCNNLGLPGNWSTTLETMKALDGLRAHLTHIQFHSYGGNLEKPTSVRSKVADLADFVNSHSGVTVDVGQVVFGDTVSMTADGAVGEFLHRLTGKKWLNHDVELETGCGIVPIKYEEKSLVHATQWAIGLEWFLSVEDPWKIALTTDHPNGGSFLAYPQIIALLMDGSLRRDMWKKLPEKIAMRSRLIDHDREYTLSEIAIITRAAPARILGLAQKGHLGTGADADATIYQPSDDRQKMFALPRFVVKAGEVAFDDGQWKPCAAALHSAGVPVVDDAPIKSWFERSSTVSWRNLTLAKGPDNVGEQADVKSQ